MGADIKLLRTRIKSVDSTLHLTRAMGLVASSKIRRSGEAMLHGREYAGAVENTVRLLASCRECGRSPYISDRGGARTKIIVIAGDRGLAGGYNAGVFRLAASVAASVAADVDGGVDGAEFIPVGKRACERYGDGFLSSENFSFEDARSFSSYMCEELARGEYDRLGIIYTKYISMMKQEAELSWLLPLERVFRDAGGGKPAEKSEHGVVFEPDALHVLNAAVPEYVAGEIFSKVRESFASEVAARRMAMDSAEKNARQMISDLQLAYNRARQGAITQEITEIVAGSDA